MRTGWGIDLYDQNHNKIIASSTRGGRFYQRIDLAPGKYYLRVNFDYQYVTCEYNLRVDFTKDDSLIVDEVSNAIFKTINANTTYKGFLYSTSDTDTFVCPDVASGASLEVTIGENVKPSMIGRGFEIDVYDGDWNVLVHKGITTNCTFTDLKANKGLRVVVSCLYGGAVECDYSIEVQDSTISKPEKVDATIKASKTTVQKGKKTGVKIISNSGGKLTVSAKSKNAKNKKYVKIKNNKITFLKKAQKGKYKFTVISAANGNYKETKKTISIRVK